MRLKEVKNDKGTYAGLRVALQSCMAINEYINENKIPLHRSDKEQRLHVTLLHSKKYLPDYESAGNVFYECKPTKFDIFPTQEGRNGLVLLLDCPALVQRHKTLMKKHRAVFDYDEYIPHVTFSYDVGDLDLNTLPPFTTTIFLNEEYGEELDIDWLATTNKLSENVLFEMSNLRKNETGLPVNIYVSSGGAVNNRHSPRIKVMINTGNTMDINQTVSVLLKQDLTSDDVVGYEKLPNELINSLRVFVNKNYTTLIDYWNDSISTKEMINKIQSI
jgi:hypothetical protein